VSGSCTLICVPPANAFLPLPTILGQQYHRSSTQEFAGVLSLSPLQVFYNAGLIEWKIDGTGRALGFVDKFNA
jgi:hypothetical protein